MDIKKKKYKIKPRFYIILLTLIIIIVLFISSLFPKSHIKNYKVKDYDVKEEFDNNNKRYKLTISNDDNIFDYNFDSKNIGKKIIKGIDTYSVDNSFCIILDIKDINTIPLCKKDGNNIDYHLIDNIDLNSYKNNRSFNTINYNKINVFDTVDKKYFIYNYSGFTYIDNNKQEDIKLFNSDYYNIFLATKLNEYLVIPNYDNGFSFKELILINTNNLKRDTWELNFEISFNSYILGTYNNSIFIVDKKNNIEYELDIKDRKMVTVGNEFKDGIILNNNKFENVSMYKLVNNNLKFDYGYDQNYILEDNKLYLKTNNTKILVSNNYIKKIVYSNNNYVYYLIGDTLYYYDMYYGEIKVMNSFEWNFNDDNIIFTY